MVAASLASSCTWRHPQLAACPWQLPCAEQLALRTHVGTTLWLSAMVRTTPRGRRHRLPASRQGTCTCHRTPLGSRARSAGSCAAQQSELARRLGTPCPARSAGCGLPSGGDGQATAQHGAPTTPVSAMGSTPSVRWGGPTSQVLSVLCRRFSTSLTTPVPAAMRRRAYVSNFAVAGPVRCRSCKLRGGA